MRVPAAGYSLAGAPRRARARISRDLQGLPPYTHPPPFPTIVATTSAHPPVTGAACTLVESNTTVTCPHDAVGHGGASAVNADALAIGGYDSTSSSETEHAHEQAHKNLFLRFPVRRGGASHHLTTTKHNEREKLCECTRTTSIPRQCASAPHFAHRTPLSQSPAASASQLCHEMLGCM